MEFRNWSWRLALLVLPWQTHLIFINGFLIYLSWLPMLVCIYLALVISPRPKLNRRNKLAILGFVALVLVSMVSAFPVATWQWWIQALLLTGFAWSLTRLNVDLHDLLTWSVISIIPHALLAIQQGMTQHVFGSTLLGIAPQDPITRGVAVVESAGVRFLRAYGGMPYPNILGGYLVFALPASIWLAYRNRLWIIASSLFAIALVLTHSRSAWIACAVLLIALAWKYRKSLPDKRAPLVVLASLVVAIIWQWPLLHTRVTAEGRLEARSVSERVAGTQAGITIFREHPWTGIGLNAFSATLPNYALPHSIPLLILAETGVIGFGALLLLGSLFCTSTIVRRDRLLLMILPVAILAALDHYLWSYWSGHVLLALLTVWMCLGVDKSAKIT
ncbi:O-antigen ligase family protein [Candidatus Uhrbacteria bacterium]|nr:O-antigen ligase family protein [Candidatus Uhrbacteria bacterium]